MDVNKKIVYCAIAIYYFFLFIFFLKFATLTLPFIILYSLMIPFPFLLIRFIQHVKIEKYEKEFPEFLRDLAYYLEIGFPLPKAIRELSKDYKGELRKEIIKIRNQMSLGFPFTYVLRKFGERVKSNIIRKTISTLEEIERAGGNIATSLFSISTALQEINNIYKEIETKIKVQTMLFYGILLLFVVIALVLKKMLYSFAYMYVSNPQVFLKEFDNVIVTILIINSIFTGFSIGKAAKGSIIRGIPHSIFLSILTILLYSLIKI